MVLTAQSSAGSHSSSQYFFTFSVSSTKTAKADQYGRTSTGPSTSALLFGSFFASSSDSHGLINNQQLQMKCDVIK